MRALRIGLKWLMVTAAIFMALALAIHVFDEEIEPEAIAFADYSEGQVPAAQNGYFALLALAAPASHDPHALGIAIADQVSAQIERNERHVGTGRSIDIEQFLGPKRVKFKGNYMKLCSPGDTACVDHHHKNADQIQRQLVANQLLMTRYHRLYDYPHFRETIPQTSISPLPRYVPGLYALVHANIALQASRGDMASALISLERDTLFWRRLLREGRLFITKLIAVQRIKHNLVLLSEIIASHELPSREIARARQILAPFDDAELDISQSFRSEFALAKDSLMMITYSAGHDFITLPLLGNHLPGWVLRPFFKQNATVNHAYGQFRNLAELAQVSPRDLPARLIEALAAEDSALKTSRAWHYLYNPVGKLLEPRLVAMFGKYIGSARNLQCWNRLVALQLLLNKERVNSAHVETYLKQAGSQYANPYTGELAQWETQESWGVLYFYGLNERSYGELMGQRIEIRL